jgi:hypothetical protein
VPLTINNTPVPRTYIPDTMWFSGRYKEILNAAIPRWKAAQGPLDKRFVLSTIVEELRNSEEPTASKKSKQLPEDDEEVATVCINLLILHVLIILIL